MWEDDRGDDRGDHCTSMALILICDWHLFDVRSIISLSPTTLNSAVMGTLAGLPQ